MAPTVSLGSARRYEVDLFIDEGVDVAEALFAPTGHQLLPRLEKDVGEVVGDHHLGEGATETRELDLRDDAGQASRCFIVLVPAVDVAAEIGISQIQATRGRKVSAATVGARHG